MISYATSKVLAEHGLRQKAPKYVCMSSEEFSNLRRLARQGLPKTEIAKQIGRCVCTIDNWMRTYQIVIAKPIAAGPGRRDRHSIPERGA